MMRLVGYFALVFGALYVFSRVPVVGELFRIPFLGFMVASALVSAGISWSAVRAVDSRRARAMVSRLGAVDTPHNQGKLGSFVLAQGRARKAIVHLERAVAGEASSPEWNYRLGSAYLDAGRASEAVTALENAVRLAPDHAFGTPWLRLSQALLARGLGDRALEAVRHFESDHGPTPESAYRRGLALARLGRGREAKDAFAEVSRLAAQSARFQKSSQRSFVLRASLRRILP
jgi:hypothetical protein